MTTKAIELYAKNYSFRAIGRELGIAHPDCGEVIEDEYARRAEHREHDREKHLSVYDEIQSAAWEAFQRTDKSSLNRSGYLNTIKAAEDSKVKLTGAAAPIKYQNVDDTFEITLTTQSLSKPERQAPPLPSPLQATRRAARGPLLESTFPCGRLRPTVGKDPLRGCMGLTEGRGGRVGMVGSP